MFTKPSGAKYISQWPLCRVTAMNLPISVDVNGIPRHIFDVRPVPVVDRIQTDDHWSRDSRDYDHEDHMELWYYDATNDAGLRINSLTKYVDTN